MENIKLNSLKTIFNKKTIELNMKIKSGKISQYRTDFLVFDKEHDEYCNEIIVKDKDVEFEIKQETIHNLNENNSIRISKTPKNYRSSK